MAESWDDLADWWVDAVRHDPTQGTAIVRCLRDLLPGTGGLTLDLGCGDGAMFAELGERCIGTDLSMALLQHAATRGPAVQSRLPDLSWVRRGSLDRAVAVGVVDLLPDHIEFFRSVHAAVRPGGHLLVVINHPVATSPESEPLVDPTGEVLWRWGSYLTPGSWAHDAGGGFVDLFHRPMGDLLTAAASCGWTLEQMVEHGPGPAALDEFADHRGQDQIPALLGVRFLRSTPGT